MQIDVIPQSVFLAQDNGEKSGKFMKKYKGKYTNEPIGKIKRVDDFLPKPKDFVLKEETTNITISLTKSSVDFFKSNADG